MILRFSRSKHMIKRGITTLQASYLNPNQITFPCPTTHFTICKALKLGSNMITIMLWTYCVSKDFKKSKKGLITFITSSRIFLCKSKILTSKRSETSDRLKSYNNLTSMFVINMIIVVKVFTITNGHRIDSTHMLKQLDSKQMWFFQQ